VKPSRHEWELAATERHGTPGEGGNQLKGLAGLLAAGDAPALKYPLALISQFSPRPSHFEDALPVLIGDRALRNFFAGRCALAIILSGVHFGP
jgi:hypothetical protein